MTTPNQLPDKNAIDVARQIASTGIGNIAVGDHPSDLGHTPTPMHYDISTRTHFDEHGMPTKATWASDSQRSVPPKAVMTDTSLSTGQKERKAIEASEITTYEGHTPGGGIRRHPFAKFPKHRGR